ncbi:MAG: type III secretion system chaperone [Kiritimatiellae bacterium]|nr:type III secretion system chaperone [Kiritimatiellia bacterium]
MEFKELVEAFAKRHGIADLVSEDDGISIDIDDIVVSVVAVGGEIAIAAEIGEPPVEGRAEFADAMLEAGMESVAFFVKSAETGKYMLMRRLSMLALDVTAFDNAIESIVNMAEVWRKMLDDFRPAAKTTTERAEGAAPSFGSIDFVQV